MQFKIDWQNSTMLYIFQINENPFKVFRNCFPSMNVQTEGQSSAKGKMKFNRKMNELYSYKFKTE